MFRSNPKTDSAASPSNGTHEPGSDSARNRLSNGVSIRGDIKFSSDLVIDGEVEGNITSTGTLTIGTHASVLGTIRAGSVTIQGLVEGNVFATERCALKAGGKLHGDIASPRMAVDENARFVGSAQIAAKNA